MGNLAGHRSTRVYSRRPNADSSGWATFIACGDTPAQRQRAHRLTQMAWHQDIDRLTRLLEEPARPTPSPVAPPQAPRAEGGVNDGRGNDGTIVAGDDDDNIVERGNRPSHAEQIAAELENFVVSSARAPWRPARTSFRLPISTSISRPMTTAPHRSAGPPRYPASRRGSTASRPERERVGTAREEGRPRSSPQIAM